MANVEISQPADGVTQLTLNRPEKLNALTYDLVSELHAALDAVDRDHGCRVVILTGAGRGFCAGLDLNGFGTRARHRRRSAAPSRASPCSSTSPRSSPACATPASRSSPRSTAPAPAAGSPSPWPPTSASAAESARFGTAFVRLGLSGCDIGVSWLLPRLIGASRAWELLLTGRVFDAAEADKLGLVTQCVADDAVLATALEHAERIKANSPFGVWMTKEVMWSNLETGSLQSGIDLENRTQILASLTEDSRRAMSGFLSRQPIAFENR